MDVEDDQVERAPGVCAKTDVSDAVCACPLRVPAAPGAAAVEKARGRTAWPEESESESGSAIWKPLSA